MTRRHAWLCSGILSRYFENRPYRPKGLYARPELVRRAVLEGDVRPAAVAAYLGIRPASITGHLRALRSAAGDKLRI